MAIPIKTPLANDKGEAIMLYITKHPQPVKHACSTKWEKSEFAIPYHWVGETTEKKEVNMQVGWMEHDGYELPVMRNIKPVKRHDLLLTYKMPKTAAVKLGTASSVVGDLIPAKRRKR